jgi:hypothetical protein
MQIGEKLLKIFLEKAYHTDLKPSVITFEYIVSVRIKPLFGLASRSHTPLCLAGGWQPMLGSDLESSQDRELFIEVDSIIPEKRRKRKTYLRA